MPKKKTQDRFIEQVIEKHGDVFTFDRTEYINDFTKVIITCKQHGDFTPTPSNILQRSGCPTCALENSSKRNRKSQQLFIEQCKQAHFDKYDYSLVEYKNNTTPVKIICPIHGMFKQKPIIHLDQRCGCPKCTASRGEMETKQWLNENNIIYVQQKKFSDLVYKKQLSYDFFLPDYNILVEYNGIQHYRNVPLLQWSNDKLETIKKRDALKREYAKEKGLRLIVVPYNLKTSKYLDTYLKPLLNVSCSST